MSKAIWTQYRAIVQTGFIDVNLDAVLEDNEGWTDYESALQQYWNYKATGLNTKLQEREIHFGTVRVDE